MLSLKYKDFLESNSLREFGRSIIFIRELLKSRSLSLYMKEEVEEDEIRVYDPDQGFITVSKSKIKELEEKFPELLKITEEMEKYAKGAFDKLGKDFQGKFDKFTDDMTQTQGVKEALGVLKQFIKENGVIKSFKILTTLIKLFKKQIEFEKRASKIVPKDEKYILKDGSEIGILIIGGKPSAIENVVKTIEQALTVENLMKVLTGKTEDLEKLEVEYLKKDGEEATGQLKDVEITADGDIKVSIENDKAGEVEKNLDEITGEAESESEVELQKKMTDVIKTKPELVKKILNFTNFISDEKNKDKVAKIDQILGA